jgi:hypothetical protein
MGVLQPLARLALRYSTRTGLYTPRNLVPATELRGNKLKESANNIPTPTHILPLTLLCEVAP